MEDLDTPPIITRTIIRGLRYVHNGTTPAPYSFGDFAFGGAITFSGVIEDQADIGWINFLCGRWSAKWKEVQKRYKRDTNYGQIKKNIPSLDHCYTEETTMIQWDM